MKVADILDKVANAQGMAAELRNSIEEMDRLPRFNTPLDDLPKKIELDSEVAQDILVLITEYIGLLEDKDVK